MKISGKIFVVTGGLAGLGLATAQHLASLGAFVAALDLKKPDAGFNTYNGHIKAIKTNVAIPEDVTAAVNRIVEWSKTTGYEIGGVICCAGILGPAKILAKNGKPMSLQHFKNVVDVSLTGTIDVIRQLIPYMANQTGDSECERGVIILVSSAAAFDGQPGQVAYSAAKGALVSLTLPLARDLAPSGIRAVCIAPGMFQTGMVAGMPAKAQLSLKRVLEFPQRGGRAEEFAGLVEHILSNLMLNGSVIRLDGATRMPSRL